MRGIAQNDDALLGGVPVCEFGDYVVGPDLHGLLAHVVEHRLHDLRPLLVLGSQQLEQSIAVCEKAVPALAILLGVRTLSSRKQLRAIDVLGRENESTGLAVDGGRHDIVFLIDWELDFGCLDCTGDSADAHVLWCKRRVEVLADLGMHAIGSNKQVCGTKGRTIGEGKHNTLLVLRDYMAELHAKVNRDSLSDRRFPELSDEDLTVDTQGLVVIMGFLTKVVGVDDGLIVVSEGHVFEVIALLSQSVVEAEVVEDAESVGGQHQGAGGGEVWVADFVDGACDAVTLKGEGEDEAGEASADDGNSLRRLRGHGDV